MLSQFFADVLPQRGYLTLWTKHNKQHIWAEDAQQLQTMVEQRGDMQGVYYATASFKDDNSRTQANVLARRCFHFDFDAGEAKVAKHGGDKVYNTQAEAIEDVRRFADESGIQPTYIISSGAGIHVYYCLDGDIPPAAWLMVATKFSALAVQFGLKQDHSCTKDSCRVMRPIGSLHENGERVSIVERNDVFWNVRELAHKVVSQLDAEAEIISLPPKRERMTSINDDVLAVEGPPKSVVRVLKSCGAMMEAAQKRGNVEEPYWRAMLGVVKFTIEGDAAAHKMSNGHPDYDAADTQAKLDRWATGPTTCAEFAKYNPTACKACPNNGKVKSPISLGAMPKHEVEALPEELKPTPHVEKPTGAPWDGAIPPGFRITEMNGHLTLLHDMEVDKQNEDGDFVTVIVRVPLTSDIFWFSQWTDAEHTDDTAQVMICRWDGKRVIQFIFDQTLIANQQKLREFLAGKSIHITTHPKAVKSMEEYAKAQMKRVKALASRPKISERLGIRILPDNTVACAHGQYMIYSDGTIHRGGVTPALRDMAADMVIPLPQSDDGVWGPEVWDEHITPKARRYVDFMRKHYAKPGLEKYQLAAMMTLASPLMPFVKGSYTQGLTLPPNGLAVSLYSQEGGRGKTTLMEAIMMAFGLPGELTKACNDMGSTDKARIARMSMLGTIPAGMDEMGSTTVKAVSELISAIANGSGRDTALRDGGMKSSAKWALTGLIAANKSQRDMIAAASTADQAIQFRLLELDVDNMPEFDHDARVEFTADWRNLAECAGALGAVIHRAICRKTVASLNELVSKCVDNASKKVNAGQTDRFQYRGLGAAFALHILLSELGLVMFELPGMVTEFVKASDSAKDYVEENMLPTDGLQLLNMALHDARPHTAITLNETRRTRHVTTFDEPLSQMPQQVHARHIVSTGITYVSSDFLKNWANDKKTRAGAMIHAAKDSGVMTFVYASTPGRASPYNLLKGMRASANTQTLCYAFDLRKLSIQLGKDWSREIDEMIGDASNVVQIPQRGGKKSEPKEGSTDTISAATT